MFMPSTFGRPPTFGWPLTFSCDPPRQLTRLIGLINKKLKYIDGQNKQNIDTSNIDKFHYVKGILETRLKIYESMRYSCNSGNYELILRNMEVFLNLDIEHIYKLTRIFEHGNHIGIEEISERYYNIKDKEKKDLITMILDKYISKIIRLTDLTYNQIYNINKKNRKYLNKLTVIDLRVELLSNNWINSELDNLYSQVDGGGKRSNKNKRRSSRRKSSKRKSLKRKSLKKKNSTKRKKRKRKTKRIRQN